MRAASGYDALAEGVRAFLRDPHADDFGPLALAIFAFQRTGNEPYARWSGAADPSRWQEIPAVPQSAFKHTALRTFPAAETSRTFRTSGTTGEGFGEHHFREMSLYEAAILRGWDWFGLPQLPQMILTPTPEDAPHSSLSYMMRTLRARAPKQRFCAEAKLGEIDEPVLLLGPALAFLHLLENGEARPLPAGSWALETGGYKGTARTLAKAELYALFQEHLGLPPERVINEYGMTELSAQAYTTGLGAPHRVPPWLRFLVIDPETGGECAEGQTGVLRLFDLANLGSVLAVETQDLAVQRGEGFELLGRDPAALPRGCSRAADARLSSLRA